MNPQSAPRLSVCMITKNEAVILGRCLEAATSVADEIIVVDTGSDDNTIAIAQQCGARVITSDWRDDFSYSRNISIEQAQYPWILWFDADDRIPAESVPLINRLKQKKPENVFGMIVRNQKPDGTGTEFIQARMFPNHPAIRFERPIHEQIMPSALRLGMQMINTEVVIEHHGYADPGDVKRKAQRNVSMLLREIDESNPDPVLFIEVADSYTIAEDQESAEVWYQKVVNTPLSRKAFPAVASQAYMGLGNIANKRKDYAQAIDYFRQAQRLCPERTDVLYCCAVSYDMMDAKEKAVAVLKQAIAMERKAVLVGVDFRQAQIKSYLRLLRILRELDNPDDCALYCEKALQACGHRQEIQNEAGKGYLFLEKLMDALHCFERSLKIIVEGNIDAYIGLCSIYLKAGKEKTAEEAITNIKSLFAAMPRYWAFCGLKGFLDLVGPVPDTVSGEDIEVEKGNIKREFNL